MLEILGMQCFGKDIIFRGRPTDYSAAWWLGNPLILTCETLNESLEFVGEAIQEFIDIESLIGEETKRLCTFVLFE